MKRSLMSPSVIRFALFSAVLTGCGDFVPVEQVDPEGGGGDGDASSDGFQYDAEEGTCDGWKVRYCEAYELCGHGSLEECIFEAEYVTCASNAPYADCEEQFQAVIDEDDCSLFPRDCYPRDVADRSAARALCEDVQVAACEFDYFCSFAFSFESCVSESNQFFQCEERLSAVPGGEACVTALNQAACGDPLPDVCSDHTRF